MLQVPIQKSIEESQCNQMLIGNPYKGGLQRLHLRVQLLQPYRVTLMYPHANATCRGHSNGELLLNWPRMGVSNLWRSRNFLVPDFDVKKISIA